ncbi:MAG: sulfurtransferase [Burkholderiales bacterium]|nr:MAG: sulfurtransferase [Burkholderiales bacterium]
MQQIQPVELASWLAPAAASATAPTAAPAKQRAGFGADTGAAPLLLDVREHWEVALCALPGSVHVPMREIPARLDELDPSRPIVCVCHHGVRSLQVAMFLEHRGFDAVFNLAGGLDAWARQVDPSMPTY